MKKRILMLLSVVALMALGVAAQAGADPNRNAHNCAGVTASTFSPQGTNKGQWGTYIRPLAHNQQADEESRATADDGNCGSNSVP
jgi:hypothetical protein